MARPSVTLKLATSLDGKIALENGASEWITCEASRHAGRILRGGHDAICVGANTAHLDNPQLTTRIEGLDDPIRVVFDSGARLSPASNLVQTAKDIPVILFHQDHVGDHIDLLKALSVTLMPLARSAEGLDILAALAILKRQGIDRLMIEGGGRLAASFVKAGVIDTIEWFRAPMILGGDGRDAIGPLDIEFMDDIYGYSRVSVRDSGVDLRETYQKKSL